MKKREEEEEEVLTNMYIITTLKIKKIFKEEKVFCFCFVNFSHHITDNHFSDALNFFINS